MLLRSLPPRRQGRLDLDLDAVAKLLEASAISLDASAVSSGDVDAGSWLDAIGAMNPLVAQFLTFRADCVAGLVAEIADEASRLGRKVSLDLFSPGLAMLVGQDYRRLSRHCVWAKPMIYRIARGPAGLRLEIPALVEGVTRLFGVDEAQVSQWAARHVRGFDQETLTQTRQSAVPLPLIEAEIEAAVSAMHLVPVYFGLELVSQPGVVDIRPADVRNMVRAGRAANAAGLIISWDLMHAPIDGVEALAEAIRS